MIEQRLEELIEAIKALTVAVSADKGAGVETVAASADEPAKRGRGRPAKTEAAAAVEEKSGAAAEVPAPAKASKTRGEVQAALTEVREKHGVEVAKGIIKRAGVEKMADIPEDKFEFVFEAAAARLQAVEKEDDGL